MLRQLLKQEFLVFRRLYLASNVLRAVTSTRSLSSIYPCRIRNVPMKIKWRIRLDRTSAIHLSVITTLMIITKMPQKSRTSEGYCRLSLTARSASRFICFRFKSSRLSYFFLPLPRPINTLATPFLIYTFSGTRE